MATEEQAGTTVVIGDVHGKSELLRQLIEESRRRWGPDVAFYGVGDFIDRGKDSKGVIQVLIDEGVRGIVGNHELWFRQLLGEKYFDRNALHPMMGGSRTLHSYGLGIRWPQKNTDRVPQSHQDYLLELPRFRKVVVGPTTYWILHAGLGGDVGRPILAALGEGFRQRGLPGDPTDDLIMVAAWQAHGDALMWQHMKVKNPDIYQFPGGVQVFGHTPLAQPMDGGHFIALDTGAGRKRGNRLSAVALHPEGPREFVTVEGF